MSDASFDATEHHTQPVGKVQANTGASPVPGARDKELLPGFGSS